MTEAEWMDADDPLPMLEFVRGKVSDRKLRLFAAACFRRLDALLPDPRQRRGIEALEQLAEGAVTLDECRGPTAEVRRAIPRDDPTDDLQYVGLMLYREFCTSSIARHAVHASDGSAGERREQARLMRCIIGCPFRPVAFHPGWQASDAGPLARPIYDERAFNRMPELADALEAAGCDDAEVLGHCRVQGDHVRWCWVLDLILGRS
jgi:hypothetical protein